MIGTLHPWFRKLVDGEKPAIEEIAMILFHGMAKGLPAMQNGMRVIAALRDPAGHGLNEWQCETALRAARGAWRQARNPFLGPELVPPPLGHPPAHGQENPPDRATIALERLLNSFFSGSTEKFGHMWRFAGDAGVNKELVHWNRNQADVVAEFVQVADAAGRTRSVEFWVALGDALPFRRAEVQTVKRMFIPA